MLSRDCAGCQPPALYGYEAAALLSKEHTREVGTLAVGIVGDFESASPTHEATNEAIQHAADKLGIAAISTWIATDELAGDAAGRLAGFDALWCAPGSPYRSMSGALEAIRIARTTNRPFLGTCGGFQHAVLEYARHVLGVADAQHAEYDPSASRLFITPLSCSLVGKTMQVSIVPGSRAFQAYGQGMVEEQYNCNFGLSPEYAAMIDRGGMHVVGTDQDGEARIVELPDHRFFVATLFVPQARSTASAPHALVLAYLEATRHNSV
jgi:CTP synthase (UTP-ammonia lyase)